MGKFYSLTFNKSSLIIYLISLLYCFFPSSIYSQTVSTITTSGTWTVPAGVTSVKVEGWGGGGAGGGAFSSTGGGGGGGAYNMTVFNGLTTGQAFTITIGSGGAGGLANGANGKVTTFSNGTLFITANGGFGGQRGGTGGAGGVGGPVSGGTGGVSFNGGTGGPSGTNGAGGGGGAGNNGNGAVGSNTTAGAGGPGTPNSAPYIGGDGAGAQTGTGNGNSAAYPGPGGGGGGANNSGGSSSGGGGAQGQVVLTYTISLPPTITSFSPGSGCANTTPVIITGTNFTGATAVQFGGTNAASFTVNSATQITATPAGGTTGAITVTTGGGTTTSAASFTVNSLPVASISYAASPYCSTSGTASVTQTGQIGGTYSSAAGLSITGSTGDVNLAASTPGTYIVTYSFSNGTCSNTTTASITITAPPSATISYNGSPYCSSGGTAAVTFSGTSGGSYSASPAGLSINSGTGTITLGTSTPGTYTVTYSIGASGGCAAFSTSTSVTITGAPVASISYAASPYCSNSGTATVTQTGQAGGTYTSTSGLSINSSTGDVNTVTSTPGTYTVTYSFSNGTCNNTASTSITITAAPSATISYSGSPFCTNSATGNVTQTGTAGGTYSASPGGLSINAATGAITPSTSTPGTYTVSYTIAASGGCAVYSTTTTVVINALPVATISYSGTPYCSNSGTATVTQTGQTGGTYSASPGGLSISSSTGSVILSTSTPGTYNVTYTIAASGGCSVVTATNTITVTAPPSATISYSGSPYCTTSGAVNVTRTGTTGGTYSASPAGLTISAGTGAITPSTSTPGTYTVTYTVPASGGCAVYTTTTSVTITALPTASISYSGSPYCTTSGTATVTQTGKSGGTYSSAPAGLSINSTTGAVNLAASTAGTYTVTYTIAASGGCAAVAATTSITVTAAPSATISYSGSPYCTTSGAVSVTRTGTAGGTYSASPAGLTITAGTGAITPSTSTAGTYTVTYTVPASGGCGVYTTTTSVTITALPTASISYSGSPYCTTSGTATVTQTGQSGGTYSSSPAGLSINSTTGAVNLTTSTAGTYTVTYTIAASGGCAAVAKTAQIIVNAPPSATISYSGSPFCNNASSKTVTRTGTAGGTYSASPAGLSISSTTGTITPSSSTAGTYTVTYTIAAAGGCATYTTTTTVTINPLPTAGNITGPSNVCQGSVINLTANASGTGPFTYTWSSSRTGVATVDNTGKVTGTGPGTTQINYTVTDAKGCTSIASNNFPVTVTQPTAGAITGPSASVCVNQTLALNSNATGVATLTYVWNSSNTPVATVNNTGVVTGVTAGTSNITYTVTDGNGCSSTSPNYPVTVNAIPTGSFTATGSFGTTTTSGTTCAGSNVTFTAPAGYSAYTFYVNGTNVQGPNTANTFSSSTLSDGASVTVNVANSQNCGASFGPITINLNPLPTPTLSVSPTGAICQGTSVTFTAGGGTNYTFKVNGSAVSINTTGSYTTTTLNNGDSVNVDVKNANGCMATSAAIYMTVNPLPVPTLTSNPSPAVICQGDNITFTAGGGTTYDFRVNGTSVPGQTGSNIFSSTTLTNPSIVTVIATTSGCNATSSPLPVTINDTPVVSITTTENSGAAPNDNKICSGGTVTFTATPGYSSYKFYLRGTGSPLPGSGNVYTTTTLVDGDFVTVVAISNKGCSNSTPVSSAVISVVASPSGTLTVSPSNVSCVGNNVTFTATSGFTNYNFQVNGSTVQNGSGNIYSTTTLASGQSVTVIVTNSNGCTSTWGPITMTVNPVPSGTLTVSPSSTVCKGTAVTFSAPAGFSNYDFQLNGTSVQSSASPTYTTSTLNNGDKIAVVIENSNNCIALSNTITMTVYPLPPVSLISPTNPVVCVNSMILLTDATAGGVWSSLNTSVASVDPSGNVTGVAAGTATINYTVTNANGCDSTVSVNVTVNASPSVAAITVNAPATSFDVCVGNTINLADATPGGTWSSATTSVATITAAGVVTGVSNGTSVISYTVANGNGCTTIVTATVTVHALPILGAITVNPPATTFDVCVGNNITLADATSGGMWSSSQTGIAIINASTGVLTGVSDGNTTISYTVTDANGCSTTITQVVNVHALPEPTLSGPNPICPGTTDTYTTEAGQSNYVWTFTGGTLVSGGTSTDNSITIKWDQPGTRTIHVNYSNSFGCTAATSVTVTSNTGTVPSLSGPGSVCLNSNGSYTTQSGFTNYTWTAVGGTVTAGGTTSNATINWTASGIDTVKVNFTDANGCTAASPTVLPVTVNTLPTATVSGTAAVCASPGTQPLITFTGANGTAAYTFTYNINGGSPQTVTTASGNSIVVNVPTNSPGTFTYNLTSVADANTCSQAQTGSATITVNPLPTATISGTTAVCQGSPSPNVTYTGTAGTAPFTFSYNINGGTTQTITTVSGNSVTLAAPTGTAGTFAYNLLSVKDANGCTQAQSGTATITVNALPTATITGTASVCQNGTANITFTGANGTAPYTFTYNINGGGNLVVVSVGNVATLPVVTTIPGTYTYNLVSVQDASGSLCSQAQSGSAVVTVNSPTVGGTVAANATVCSGSNNGTLTLSGNTGSVTSWQSSTDGGTTWTSIANTTTSLTYTNLVQTTQYRAVVQSGACASANSSVATITVSPASVGGTVSSSQAICSGSTPADLSLAGNTGNVVKWQKATDAAFATAVDIANTTNTLTGASIGPLTVTTYFRAVVQSGVCGTVNSASAAITVNPLPTATISGTATVCQNSPQPVVSFTGAKGTAPYTFTYTVSGTPGNQTVTSVGNAATVSAPTATAGVFTYTLVSVTDASSTSCSQSQSGSAVITVNAPPPAFTITPASATICLGTIQPLYASVSGSSSGTFTQTVTVNRAIPDANSSGNPGTLTNSIAVSGIPAGAVINSVTVNFSITHPYDYDLVLNLKAPNGKVLNLVNQDGPNPGSSNASTSNFTNTTISSTTANPVSGNAPFTGTYKPDATNNVGAPDVSNVNSFSSLNGTPNGNWTLEAADIIWCHGFGFFGTCFGNTYSGTLQNWTLTINYTVPSTPVNVTWSPATGLYTDAGATTAYTGQSVSTVYANPSTSGNVTYTATATNASSCSTSESVVVSANPAPVVTLRADYCAVPGKVVLAATSVPAATSYIWTTGSTFDTTQVDVAGVFSVTAFLGTGCPGKGSISVSQELVVNGNFNAGNVGFTSSYPNKTGIAGGLNYPPGYAVDTAANYYAPTFLWGKDHTSGHGNFMMVNGTGANYQIWQETLNVLPNTTYYFSAWGLELDDLPSPPTPANAILQFNVNGAQVGTFGNLPRPPNNIHADSANHQWVRFYGTWTSGPTTTTAIVSITDLQPAVYGNNFGIDDISFATLSTFINLVSAPGTDGQTICKNQAISNIVYTVGNGNSTGPTVSGLPAGITSTFSGNFLTISGTPTVAGNYTYTITTNGCNPQTVTGTITINADKITLSSGSASPTICANAPVNIGFALSGTATNISGTSTLPSGFTGNLSGTTYTLTGTNATPGTYPYTIITSGSCIPDTARGIITVTSQTVTLNSANDSQTVCINSKIDNIQYTVGPAGASATVTSLPNGVTFTVNSGIVIISGTPTQAGDFTYTVTSSGTCSDVNVTGQIHVTPMATLVLTTANSTQTTCINSPITNIQYTLNNATTTAVAGLPAGVTGSLSGGVFTITGTPDTSGTFNYAVTTSGGCGSAVANGTITVQSQTVALTTGNASPSVCQNAPMTAIVYTIGGTAGGATVTGLPSGVNYVVSGNTITISGTPTGTGPFNYTVTVTGSCTTNAVATGTITVEAGATGGTLASNSICSGGNGSITLTGQSGTIDHWELSTDGGTTWTNVVNNTITLNYTNVTTTTLYRVWVTSGCGGVYSSDATIGINNLWAGTKSTDWNDGGNWSSGSTPTTACPTVHVPVVASNNYPVLSTGPMATIINLQIDAGASVAINGNTLQIAGTITNNGDFNPSKGTIEFNGTSAQVISGNMFDNNTIGNLTFSNAAGLTFSGTDTVNVLGMLTFTKAGTLTTNNNLVLKSSLDSTAGIGALNAGDIIQGNVGVERYISSGVLHQKSWQMLAVPTQGQTIRQSWMEGATVSNVVSPTAGTAGNPHAGYGTMMTSNLTTGTTFQNGFDIYTQPGPSIKVYDYVSNSYIGPPNTDPTLVYNQKGYMILVRGDRSVNAYNQAANATIMRTKGILFTPGNPPPVTNVIAGNFESVGNPYASVIDLRKIIRGGGTNEFIFAWDPQLAGAYGLGAFQTLSLNGSDYYATPGGGSYGSGPNNYLQSGQAFFVQATGSNGTVSFNETVKASVTNSNMMFLRTGNISSPVAQIRANLYAVNSNAKTTLADGNLIQYNKAYSNKIDGMDARKISNFSENFGILSQGKNLAIERRSKIIGEDTIFYNLTGLATQGYRVEFIANGLSVYNLNGFVEDTYLNTSKPLNLEGTTDVDFVITGDKGSKAANRFRIVFKKASSKVVPVTFVSVNAVQKNSDIPVDWKVQNEHSIQQYEVQKSLDGVRFTVMSTLNAVNKGAGSYEWIDKNVSSGLNYYRIKTIAEDGSINYTAVVKVLVGYGTPSITVNPNPIKDGIIHLQFRNQPAGTYGIRLMNPLGQIIVSKQVGHGGGNATENITWDYNLAHGIYQLEIVKPGGGVEVIKVMY
ncbi:MAG: beta strand repeat-containing protein [Ginsengibacter sp.]